MTNHLTPVTWPGWETARIISTGDQGMMYEIIRDSYGDLEEATLRVISIPRYAGEIDDLYSDGYDRESILELLQACLNSVVAEYSTVRRLDSCPNIISYQEMEYRQHDDGIGWDVYIRMERVTPLIKTLPDTIPENTVVAVAKDISTALAACADHKIVHRDIRPQSIYVSESGSYKLGDFGIARTKGESAVAPRVGIKKYMAPEIHHHQPYGPSADVYSLGLTLYWMLNDRRLPFLPPAPEKLTADMDETARNRRLSGEQLPPPAHGSEELKRIVLKACAYDPKDRYRSARELLAQLNGIGTLPEDSAEDLPDTPQTPDEKVQKQDSQPIPQEESEDDFNLGPYMGLFLIFLLFLALLLSNF